MCGIVGYTGRHEASPILVAGLRRLEYRGYDSAGVATHRRRTAGRAQDAPGGCGCWRSCSSGEPRRGIVRDQPHPLGDARAGHRRQRPPPPRRPRQAASVAVVHNGVIENHASLRRELEAQGFAFRSQTDTEVIAHLIARELGDGRATCSRPCSAPCPGSRGRTAWRWSARACPGEVVGARLGSPLVVGLGEGEHLLASDAVAIAPHTARVAYLAGRRGRPADARTTSRSATASTARSRRGSTGSTGSPTRSSSAATPITCSRRSASSPTRSLDACRGRLRRAEATAQFGGLNLTARQLRRVRRVVFAACGTSWHAALVGEYLIERLAHLPVEVEYASEFRYRNAPLDDRTLVFVLSQSGETADTLGALREAKRHGHPDAGDRQHRRQHDRPRGRRRHLPARRPRGRRRQHQGVHRPGGRADAAGPLPRPAAAPLVPRRPGRRRCARVGPRAARRGARRPSPRSTEAAERIAPARSALFLGRDIHFPVALEGAPEAQGDQLHPRRGLSRPPR